MSLYSMSQLGVALDALHLPQAHEEADHKADPQTVALLGGLLDPLKASPVKNLGNIKELLNSAVLVYKTTRAALESLERMKLTDFDALVSDCACQLRALFIANVARRYLTDAAFKKEVTALKTELSMKITQLQNKAGSIAKNKEGTPVANESLAKILTAEHAEVEVSPEIRMLAEAYLLTKTKVEDYGKKTAAGTKGLRQRTEYTTVRKQIHKMISDESIVAIVDGAKVSLATTSVAYIRKEAKKLQLDPLVTRLLDSSVRILGREELPCYASIMAVFESCRQRENPIPVLLKIRKAALAVEQLEPYDVTLLLKSAGMNGGFIATAPTKEDLGAPVIVVEAQRYGEGIQAELTREYLKRLMRARFMSLAKLNAAAHKQYSDGAVGVVELEKMAQEESPLLAEYELLKKNAVLHGCCVEAQTLLRMTHIYCDTLAAHKFSAVKAAT